MTHSVKHLDVIVIGAGASGLMCASTAGQRGRRVLVLDHARRAGEKIRVSGGGRCNFTNLNVEPEHYLSQNPHFCKSALRRFSQYDFLALIEKYHIDYEERELGQLFCVNSAGEIVHLLEQECRQAGVGIQLNCTIARIRRENERFVLQSSRGEFSADSLVIATGGLSFPQIGASGFGYEIVGQFGLKLVSCREGLVSLTLHKNTLGNLSGISVDVVVSCRDQAFREALLFTHRGLSGPAILQISNYWQPGDKIEINLLPNLDLAQRIRQWQKQKPDAELKNLLSTLLTKRLAQQVLTASHPNKAVKQYNEREIEAIAHSFHHWCLCPSGTEGYRKAEVTRGGIDTNELSSKTFETKKVKGLYFIGEVLDVTGWLGGYNLQWAWSSGYCAGLYV